MPSSAQRDDRSWLKPAAYALFACSFVFAAARPIFQKSDGGSVLMRDFVSPYTGARCLLAGCNPYDLQQVQNEFRSSGGAETDHAPWEWEPPVYPPSSLIVLLPTALFSFHAARAIWFGLSVVVFSAALLATAFLVETRYRSWALLLGAGLLSTRVVGGLLGIGQPSAMAIGMGVLALFLLLQQRFESVAIILLGLSLALKPQLAGALFLLLMLRRRTRKPALLAGIFASMLMFAGAVWLSMTPASRDWVRDYRAQLATSLWDGVNNPAWNLTHGNQMLNLQASFAIFDSPAVYETLTWSVSLILLAICAATYYTKPESREIALQTLAAIACICLLPAYHREYDLPILMLTFPALIRLVSCRARSGIAAVLLTVPLLYLPYRPSGFMQHYGSAPWLIHAIPIARVRVLLFARQQPLVILCLASLYTFVLIQGAYGRTAPPAQAE